MRKLRLELDALTVESFPTTADERNARGTVRAREECDSCGCSLGPNDVYTCGCKVSACPCDTCDTSCAGGPFCDCLPSGPCETCDTSCAGGPYCDCVPTPGC